MIIINKENPYYRELLLLKRKFNQFNKGLFEEIISALLLENENILTGLGQIDLYQFDKTKKYKYFYDKNTARLDEGRYIKKIYTDLFLEKIIQYKELESSGERKVTKVTDEAYKANIPIEDYNSMVPKDSKYNESDNKIIPKESYTIVSFIENMKTNIYSEHLFNSLLKIQYSILNTSKIQRIKLRIIGFIEKAEFPITYKAYCSAFNIHTGGPCERSIEYTLLDMASTLKCNFGNNRGNDEQDHPIKTTKGILNKSVYIYGYAVEIEKENGEFEEVNDIFWFLEEQNNSVVDCNFIRYSQQTNSKDMKIFLVLASNSDNKEKRVDGEIITNSKKHNFLEDIFHCIKKYCRKEHGIIIRDDNKIVSLITIFQCMSQILGKPLYFMVLGKSGSGKSFITRLIPPLFLGRYTVVNGPQVTKNRILGGTGTKVSAFSSNVFQKGVVALDFVSVEEIGTSFDDFSNNKTSNIFTMLKMTYNGKVPISSQGTIEYDATAAISLSGNYKQSVAYNEYLKAIIKEYGTKEYDHSWPVLMPIEYYITKLKNVKLAKAHYKVRFINNDHTHKNFITGLPSAEMNRYPLFVTIEGEESNELTDFYEEEDNYKKPVHREQILEEIGARIKKDEFRSPEFIAFSKEQIYPYLKDDFFSKRQNYRPEKKNINNHLKKNIFWIAKIYFFCQKKFYGEDLILTEEDKKLFEEFMLYNYNVLTEKQAKMEEKPFFNDYSGFNKNGIIDEIIEKEIQRDEEAKEHKEFSFTEQSDDIDDFADNGTN